MAKFSPEKLNKINQKRLLAEFYKAATLIDNYQEAKNFFKDLLTLKERTMLARRLQIAIMLIEGYTYDEIKITLKIGMGTIANVQKWLTLGGQGYKTIIERLLKHEKKIINKKIKLSNPISPESIKRKYALMYWPEETLKEFDEFLRKHSKRKSLPKSDEDL